jgi:RNA polymerase sigma factor (TIGR02999 family)
MTAGRRSPRAAAADDLELDEAKPARELLPRVYEALRRLSARYLRRLGRPDTLQTTALVHEAFLKLAKRPTRTWRDHDHFAAVAARAMRQILVDHARKAQALKRGARTRRVTLPVELVPEKGRAIDLLELDDALDRLRRLDEGLVSLVELRLFAGLRLPAAARILGISKRTAERDWALARAWLRREFSAR